MKKIFNHPASLRYAVAGEIHEKHKKNLSINKNCFDICPPDEGLFVIRNQVIEIFMNIIKGKI